jgi:type IV pilus assembly protein PilY1
MKKAIIFLASLFPTLPALATDLASVPLDMKSSVKPNVIFALDDSGSMDFEVLLSTSDGALWWEKTAKSFVSNGVPSFNSSGVSGTSGSQTWYKYAYLFPNGSTTDARHLTDSTYDHFAIPPIPAYAWVRSAAYNPLFYDPSDTYVPWKPAYVGGGTRTFIGASPTAARSHPIDGTLAHDLTATLTSTNSNWTFKMLPGMTIPGVSISGITGKKNGSGAFGAVTTNYAIPSNETWDVSIPYFMATYYVLDSTCTSGTSCATGPDGQALRRYQIKPGQTFPSGR